MLYPGPIQKIPRLTPFIVRILRDFYVFFSMFVRSGVYAAIFIALGPHVGQANNYPNCVHCINYDTEEDYDAPSAHDAYGEGVDAMMENDFVTPIKDASFIEFT